MCIYFSEEAITPIYVVLLTQYNRQTITFSSSYYLVFIIICLSIVVN